MASGDTKTEQMLDILANGGDTSSMRGCCNTKTQNYILDAADRIQKVEDDVEEMKNNPDVADIVATYADLTAYDKSKLTDKDVIRVLADETHDGDSTYYRYSKSSDDFTYIGESKQYTNFVGTDGQTAGVNGLVPAPATTDAGKFLKADGTWDTAGSTINVVQTTGTSQTDVMSQNATTSLVYADPNLRNRIKIGQGASASIADNAIEIGHDTQALSNFGIALGSDAKVKSWSQYSIAIGQSAECNSDAAIAIGYQPQATALNGVAIGRFAKASKDFSIALGAGATVSANGELNVGTGATYTTKGYNNSNYRLISGVYDGQGAHDAVTVGQINDLIDAINSATGANISHIGA